jgi:LysR family transcriptional regulator, glycine cleavage system transcriptional activator
MICARSYHEAIQSGVPQLPTLDMLDGFIAVAQTLSFRRGAQLVALTPAALGQRIRTLEELCGTPLFRRTTRSVALTEAGRRLVPRAQSTLSAAGMCVAAARGPEAPLPIEIVLGTRPDLGMSWLMPLHGAIAAALPELTTHVYFGAGDDLLARLRTREIDCAVTSSRFADPRLDGLPLHREDFVFVGAPALLRRRPLTRAAHAADHVLIDTGPDAPLFRCYRDAPGGGELAFARLLRLGSLAAIQQLVLEGEGVAVLPRYFAQPAIARRRLRVVFPRVRLLHDHFRLVYRVDDPNIDTYRALAAVLRTRPLA